jgi:hypothetical protein
MRFARGSHVRVKSVPHDGYKWALGREGYIEHQAHKLVYDPTCKPPLFFMPIRGWWLVCIIRPELRGGYAYAGLRTRDLELVRDA